MSEPYKDYDREAVMRMARELPLTLPSPLDSAGLRGARERGDAKVSSVLNIKSVRPKMAEDAPRPETVEVPTREMLIAGVKAWLGERRWNTDREYVEAQCFSVVADIYRAMLSARPTTAETGVEQVSSAWLAQLRSEFVENSYELDRLRAQLAEAEAGLRSYAITMQRIEESENAALAEKDKRIGELEADIREIDECFQAALCEGLNERLAEAEGDAASLKGLVERRLLFAGEAATRSLLSAAEKGRE